jgi:hypothetical protein
VKLLHGITLDVVCCFSLNDLLLKYISAQNYRFIASTSSPKKASIRYTLRQLEIRQDDIKATSENKNHICKPVIRSIKPTPFTLSKDMTMRCVQSYQIFLAYTLFRFIRLIGNEYCMIAIEDQVYLRLYLDRINAMDMAVAAGKSKRMYLEKTGRGALFAVEESKRLFAILVNHQVGLFTFISAWTGSESSQGVHTDPCSCL